MSTPHTAANRRQYERHALKVTAAIALSSTQIIEVRTIDISLGGIGIIVQVNLPSATVLAIRIPLPSPKGVSVIETRAEVTYSVLASDVKGFKVGLRFLDLDASATAALIQFLK